MGAPRTAWYLSSRTLATSAATQRRLSQPSTSAPYRQDFSENQPASFLNSRTLGVCNAPASVLFSFISGGPGRNAEAVVATKYLCTIPPRFSGNSLCKVYHMTFPADRLGAKASAFDVDWYPAGPRPQHGGGCRNQVPPHRPVCTNRSSNVLPEALWRRAPLTAP